MRIFKKGKKWYVDYTYRRKRYRKAVSRSKREAEWALHDIELKIVRREHLGVVERKNILFEDCVEKYLVYSQANKSEKSYKRDDVILKLNLAPEFTGKYLDEITAECIERYKIARLHEVKPATVNRELACLRHMLNKAIEWGYLMDNPMKNVAPMKTEPERVRYLELDEIQGLLAVCTEHLRPIVLCALHTGMRKGEILNLKWSDIDLDQKTLTLEKTKTNRRRTIPLSGILLQEVKRLPKRSKYVFPNQNGNPFTDIKRSFHTALKRACIENFRFHDLRHTFASHLVMSGHNIRVVQQLLGHADIKTTTRYSHLSKQHLEEAVNCLSVRYGIGTNLAPQPTELPKNKAGEWIRTTDLRITNALLFH